MYRITGHYHAPAGWAAERVSGVVGAAELAGLVRRCLCFGSQGGLPAILAPMVARFPLQVARFVVPISGQIVLDDQGMLATYDFFGTPPGDLIQAATLASAGSLCLLGEPGAGKTTALQALIGDLPAPDDAALGQDATLWVSLAEVTDRAAFHELVARPVLARSPRVQGARRAPTGWTTLVLDGVDECPLPNTAKTLAGLLGQMLRDADTSALRVLLSCRTAEYPELVGSVLTGALPAFDIYVLAPLSRQDVHDLAASRVVEPDAFLSAVASTGTGPLASLPLTLDLLLRHYSDSGGLEGRAAELYETALRALADEPDPDRAREQRTLGSGEQRLAVAARLCCYLLLCGRAAFWTGGAGGASSSDLEPSRLAGGEVGQTGGTFAVTSELVDAALRSALFTVRGPGRLVPAHATFTAYLTARHLAASDLPEPQLRTLLTVQTDTGSTGIVASLRETAAWLVALRPESTGWLADVEPVSLAAHGAIINDPNVRHLIVEQLLADPRAALAGGWYTNWHLAHPGLGSQLADVLSPLVDPIAPQPPREQSYLALCLAGDADADPLMPTLLGIAARRHVDPGLRALAIDAAAQLDHAAAAPVLAEVLEEITAHPDHDPDDEIRGALLEAAWPRQLSVTELVQALTVPQRDDFFGRYAAVRSHLTRQLSDDDVPHLLLWALAGSAVDQPGTVSTMPFHDTELVRALLDRAFTCQEQDKIIGPTADLIAAQMRADQELEVPAALDERHADGAETSNSRALRRLLVSELIAKHGGANNTGQLIIWGWQPSRTAATRHDDAVRRGRTDYPHARRGLLDSTDLPWVLEQAQAAAPERAGIYLPLLRWLYDPIDLLAQETAWSVKDTPLWPAFAPWFDPLALGSEAAAQARRDFELSQRRRPVWEEAPQHAARILDLYERASSEPPTFWQLLYLLQVDPVTGRGVHHHSDDIADRPGIRLLPGDWLDHLREAAWNYLHEGAPIDEEFVDKPTLTSWPAEAGYLALTLLARHEAPGRTLDDLDRRVLADWAAAILAFPAVPANAGDSVLKRALLARLADAASGKLPGLVDRIIVGHLRLGWRPSELALLDNAYTDAVGDVFARRLPEVIAALRNTLASGPGTPDPGSATPADLQDVQGERQRWDQRVAGMLGTIALVVRLLARCRHADGIRSTLAVIAGAAAPHAEQATVQAARIAATALLDADATYWPEVLNRTSNAPDFARVLLQDLAGEREAPALVPSLTEVQLAELWALLAQFWPYQQDVAAFGGHYFGPDEQAQHWRDAVLDALAQRGTSRAVRLLTDLAANHTSLPWLNDLVRTAQALEREQSWGPADP